MDVPQNVIIWLVRFSSFLFQKAMSLSAFHLHPQSCQELEGSPITRYKLACPVPWTLAEDTDSWDPDNRFLSLMAQPAA